MDQSQLENLLQYKVILIIHVDLLIKVCFHVYRSIPFKILSIKPTSLLITILNIQRNKLILQVYFNKYKLNLLFTLFRFNPYSLIKEVKYRDQNLDSVRQILELLNQLSLQKDKVVFQIKVLEKVWYPQVAQVLVHQTAVKVDLQLHMQIMFPLISVLKIFRNHTLMN